MTVAQVAAGVRGLARLHSQYWGERLDHHSALAWVEPFVAFQGLEYAPLQIAHARLGDTVPAEIIALSGTELFVDIWARYIGSLTGRRGRRRHCCTAMHTSATPTSCPAMTSASWTGRCCVVATFRWTSVTSSRAR